MAHKRGWNCGHCSGLAASGIHLDSSFLDLSNAEVDQEFSYRFGDSIWISKPLQLARTSKPSNVLILECRVWKGVVSIPKVLWSRWVFHRGVRNNRRTGFGCIAKQEWARSAEWEAVLKLSTRWKNVRMSNGSVWLLLELAVPSISCTNYETPLAIPLAISLGLS